MKVLIRFYNNRIVIMKEYDLESFGKDVISFGRSSECDIRIDNKFVSRLHGCFFKENGKWFIKDMESRYGLLENNTKIDVAELIIGEKIWINDINGNRCVTIAVQGTEEVNSVSYQNISKAGKTNRQGNKGRRTLVICLSITIALVLCLTGILIWNHMYQISN